MVIIKYDFPKRYGSIQWFVTTLKKGYEGDSFRHFVSGGMDYFNIIGMYDIPTIRELKRNGTIEPMPDSLKSHIFRVIFTYKHDSTGFVAIRNLLGIKG